MSLVLLRDRDDQTEVRVDHQVLRLLVAALDPLGELDLFGGRQQVVAASLVEEELEGVGRRDGEVAVDVGLRLGVRAAAVVRERNAPLFELLEESGRLILVELGLGEEVGHRGEVEATLFLALLQQYL